LISNPHFDEEAREIRESDFIKRVHVDDGKAVDLLRRITGLDMGESEAIILSDTCKADLLLMDEVKGRHVAQQMGIRIMGTIGLLMIDGSISWKRLLWYPFISLRFYLKMLRIFFF
jgi:predicted nucleic acid-binding protein